ncbi:MAG: hypothetical protein EXR29_03040 [Betaproteobacteria bacterium]|nr:hypothetical protein [Betaproteobacteria bacterium]
MREGSVFRQPALARTLGTIAHEGPRTFYAGAITQALVAEIRKRGGALHHSPLRRFR